MVESAKREAIVFAEQRAARSAGSARQPNTGAVLVGKESAAAAMGPFEANTAAEPSAVDAAVASSAGKEDGPAAETGSSSEDQAVEGFAGRLLDNLHTEGKKHNK